MLTVFSLVYLCRLFLVTPGNPQRCNSTIAERSIYFYVSLFTLRVIALVKIQYSKIAQYKSACH